jgi:hypothetical protein
VVVGHKRDALRLDPRGIANFVETLRRNCPAGIRRWALYLGWESRLLFMDLETRERVRQQLLDFSLPNTLNLTG